MFVWKQKFLTFAFYRFYQIINLSDLMRPRRITYKFFEIVYDRVLEFKIREQMSRTR